MDWRQLRHSKRKSIQAMECQRGRVRPLGKTSKPLITRYKVSPRQIHTNSSYRQACDRRRVVVAGTRSLDKKPFKTNQLEVLHQMASSTSISMAY